MTDKAEALARLETMADGTEDWRAASSLREAIELIQEQQAEIATLRDQIKRAEEQEPVGFIPATSFRSLCAGGLHVATKTAIYRNRPAFEVVPLYTKEPK